MPLITSAEQARANRRRGQAADGVTFWHTLYLGTTRYNMAPGTPDPEPGTLFPMAFLVEQDPGSTAHAHYHQADQFQVVVDGRARLGTHEVAPVTVHFAGAYTAYGPIRASEDGVHYFTLRNGFDPGARFMERRENREALRAVANRRHREAVAGPDDASPPPGGHALLDPEPDGLAAWRYRLAPGETLTGPPPQSGQGQYLAGGRWQPAAGGRRISRAVLCVRLPRRRRVLRPGRRRRAGRGGDAVSPPVCRIDFVWRDRWRPVSSGPPMIVRVDAMRRPPLAPRSCRCP